MKAAYKYIYFFLFITLAGKFYSQTEIKGKIYDKQTKQSLAFVTILEKGTNNGTLSDIDGKFSLITNSNEDEVKIVVSYIGYIKQEININLKNKNELKIFLQNDGLTLDEVVVKPGINPALRIIKRTAKNREINNPEKMHSFAYDSYTKMFVTKDLAANEDSVGGFDQNDKTSMSKFFAKQHLFLTESVSKRLFLKPDKNHEEVLASRVSGFKAAPFTLLASQMQSFSFYNDWIKVFDIEYLNPISDIAISKYDYQLQDTLYEKSDSVFIISFNPKKGKNFTGLKGVLYINTNTYAVQNVIAEPSEEDAQISIKIQQKYEFIENQQWFPVQLNTDWIYKNVKVSENKEAPGSNLKAISRSYVREIKLNPEISKKEFSEVEVSIDKNADQKDDAFWNQYRTDSLSKKDKTTYKTVDSIGKKENFDKKALAFEAILTGKIPIKFVSLDLDRFINYNNYEGYRLGAGLHTNHKISEAFSVGGYFAYGTYDKAWKYGGDAEIRLWKRKELKWYAEYKKDVLETASFNFEKASQGLNNNELIRNLSIRMMDKIEKMESGFSFRALKYFKIKTFVNHQERISKAGYLSYKEGTASVKDTFRINEAGIKIKFVFKEKFMQTLRNKISLGSDYPEIYLNVQKGISSNIGSLNGNWSYFKTEFKFNYTYKVRTYGKQNICLIAGNVNGDVPYSLLYNGIGNNLYKIGVASEHCFETMQPNEFISDNYAALFFSHKFGKIIKPNKKFNPELELAHNMGIGSSNNTSRFANISYKTMEYGFFESGIKFNCLIKSGFSGIGVGAFYRYGPNSFSIPSKNLVFKLSLGVSVM